MVSLSNKASSQFNWDLLNDMMSDPVEVQQLDS